MRNFSADWFSLNWFKWSTLNSFEWVSPAWLYLLVSIPLLILLNVLIQRYNRQTLKVALPKTFLKNDPLSWLRFLPLIAISLAFMCFLIALARPQKSYEEVKQWTQGIDIMLAIDISESMNLGDLRPNRLEAAKNVALDFIAQRQQNKIGLVLFSGNALSYCPLTIDYDFLASRIRAVNFGIGKRWQGTAIGNALAVAVNRMKESESKSKVIILISDGDNNAGNFPPETAAEAARDYDIKIYSIGIGRDGQQPFIDQFGNTRYIQSNLNEKTLKDIAAIGKGRFFRATDNRTLERIFKIIDGYEKTEIFENRYTHKEDYYNIYVFYGLILTLIWLAFKATFIVNILKD